MPTATEMDLKQEMAEQTEQVRPVTFNSRSENQILTRRPPRFESNEFGQRVVVTEDEWMARMKEREDQTGESFDDTPWKVEFTNHFFTTDHPKLIRWLQQHDKLGVNAPSGFWEVPPTEDELRPTLADQFAAIARANADPDLIERVNALIEIRENEKDTHNRPPVVLAAEAAIEVAGEEPSESEAAAGDTGNGDSSSTSNP